MCARSSPLQCVGPPWLVDPLHSQHGQCQLTSCYSRRTLTLAPWSLKYRKLRMFPRAIDTPKLSNSNKSLHVPWYRGNRLVGTGCALSIACSVICDLSSMSFRSTGSFGVKKRRCPAALGPIPHMISDEWRFKSFIETIIGNDNYSIHPLICHMFCKMVAHVYLLIIMVFLSSPLILSFRSRTNWLTEISGKQTFLYFLYRNFLKQIS